MCRPGATGADPEVDAPEDGATMAGVSTDAPALPPSSQPDPPVNQRRRRWLLAGLAVWGVLLLVLTLVSVHRDEPTVREQRSIEQARPVVDRVLGELVAAAGPDAVVEITERRVRDGCQLTVVRDGATLEAAVVVHAPEADVPALFDRIADGLPAAYRAGVRHSADGTTHALRADAGEFVAIEGGQAGPGAVALTVSTGCRPASGDPDDRAVHPPPPDDEDPTRVLTALGATDPTPVDVIAANCPGRGTVRTTHATGRRSFAGPPSAVLPRPADAVVVADTSELYAYRSGAVSVVIESDDGRIRVATTTGCAG